MTNANVEKRENVEKKEKRTKNTKNANHTLKFTVTKIKVPILLLLKHRE